MAAGRKREHHILASALGFILLQHSMSFSHLLFRAGRGRISTAASTLPLTCHKRAQRNSLIALGSSTRAHSDAGPAGCCPLQFETLPHRGAEVRLPEEGVDNDSFLRDLRSSLAFWSANDYASAWVHVPSSRASIVEALTADGESDGDPASALSFDLHHVNATEGTIVLKRWLLNDREDYVDTPEGQRGGNSSAVVMEDKVPPFATHQVGCAGFVLSDNDELLLVKEWSGPPSNRTPTAQWKLPGGLIDPGESFGEGCCREVMEETGVPCEFVSLLAFWHRHGLVFGKSDLYFVCRLRPKSKAIDVDPAEVSDATWMPVDEFWKTENHPLIRHVLKNVYGMEEGGVGASTVSPDGGKKTRKPLVEIAEGSVQWPNRQPYPTYIGRIGVDC